MYNHLRRFSGQYRFVIFFILAIPALYAYNPLPLFFLNDDFIHVPLSQLATWGQRNSIRPFNDISLYIDYLVWGNNPVGYHFTNLLLHLIDSVLIYFLSVQVFRRFNFQGNEKFWSACAALFFWGYAFHSEGVFWVIGRTGPLSSFFFLICFLIFLNGNRNLLLILLSYVCFFCGLLTYESVFILPPALLILAVGFKQFRSRTNIFFVAGYWVLFIAYLFLRVHWTGELAGNYEAENVNKLNIGVLAANYCKLFVRSFVAPQLNGSVFAFSVAAFLVAIIAAIIFFVKRNNITKPVIWLLLIFFLSYIPYISLGIDTHGVESERYLYLPSIFVCILLAAFFSSWKKKDVGLFIFFLYFLYNQYYLLKSSKAFVIASDITKKTMEIVKENPNCHHIYFKNLPQENYGVPMFRLGLEQGINWQTKNDTAFKNVNIISLNEDEFYRLNNKLEINLRDTSQFKLPVVMKRKMTGNKEGYIKTDGSLFYPETDLLIDYTDTGINVFR